jgi:hypothetical protein
MYNVLHVYFQTTGADGTTRIRADISVSAEADLPNDDKLLVDSVAFIRQTGKFVTKDEDGKWYAADGSGEV